MKKEDWPRCHECEFFDEKKFYCKQFLRSVTLGCPNGETKKPRNHFEEIKAMSMEEMADFLCDIIHDWGEGSAYLRAGTTWIDDWLKWLKEDYHGET